MTIFRARSRFTGLAVLTAAFCAFAAACTSGTGHPPTARALLLPAYVPAGTPATVTFDGSASANALDDPQALHPLRFAWTIEDPTVTFAPDAASPRATAQVDTQRPLVVHLTVTDWNGSSGDATATLGITLP